MQKNFAGTIISDFSGNFNDLITNNKAIPLQIATEYLFPTNFENCFMINLLIRVIQISYLTFLMEIIIKILFSIILLMPNFLKAYWIYFLY